MNNFFMTNHSPKGANASFAFGNIQKGGGFALQDARVQQQEIYIGTFSDSTVKCLPFYSKATNDYRDSFVKADNSPNPVRMTYYTEEEIDRKYDLDTDTIIAKDEKTDISYCVYTPLTPMPEPSDKDEFKSATAPLVMSKLTVDNTKNDKDVIGLFSVGGIRGIRFIQNDLQGIATIDGYGFCAERNEDINLRVICDFDPIGLFGREPEKFVQLGLAPMGGLVFDVKAGQKVSINICLGFYLGGIVTHGTKHCKYYYTKFFKNIDEVFRHGLDNAEYYMQIPSDEIHTKYQTLSDERKFLMAHAVHSYYTSAMLFEDNGAPLWMVNEGSFMMMSTLDLTIDHSFFDLVFHPWVVENQINSYINMISYEDQLGISFNHDFGSFNTFTEKGYSSYEISNQDGCFSYMTQEQLCNFILLCGLYYNATANEVWLNEKKDILLACFSSMLNRDNPDPALRTGTMSFDSSRCGDSAEITTFDSLDPSLGQAKDNLYIATKCFSSYILLEKLFDKLELAEKTVAAHQASLAANTICDNFDPALGYIPALFDGIEKSAIIPAIEALIYPYYCGLLDKVDEKLINVMKTHFSTIMKKELCIFEDDGWKLSSNNINSWISKIFICQVVSENVLGFDADTKADLAHVKWWTEGCKENPAVDQIFAGTTSEVGFHYPRAVTSILFL